MHSIFHGTFFTGKFLNTSHMFGKFSLSELVKHERNGLVFKDAAQLTTQLEVKETLFPYFRAQNFFFRSDAADIIPRLSTTSLSSFFIHYYRSKRLALEYMGGELGKSHETINQDVIIQFYLNVLFQLSAVAVVVAANVSVSIRL